MVKKFGILENFIYLCTVKSKLEYESDMYRAVTDQERNV